MDIQFNTDKTINGNEKHELHFTSLITEALNRFQSHITRIEVHVSDENGSKTGVNDIRCLLEARIEGRQPISVSAQAGTIESALSSALNKLKASLETIIGRIQNY
jgi:ribosome-associated translation inhibitor RaiA